MAKKNIGKHTDPTESFLEQESKPAKKARKQAKKETVTKSKTKIHKGFLILLGIFLVIAIIAVIFKWDQIFIASDSPVAEINGEKIMMSELDNLYSRLPEQTRLLVTKQDLLDQMINEKVLVQEAEKIGITVNQSEIDDFLFKLIQQSGLTREEFDERIAAQNITNEMINDEVYKQLIITKLYQQEIIDKTNITDGDIEDYYIENLDQFKTAAQVRAEHILICHNESFRCESNITKAEALAKMEDIKARLSNTSFEDLAKEYSQDPSAETGGDLGYFEKGQMVQPFEDAAFTTPVGNVSDIVETQYGYHLVKVLDYKKETVSEIEEVKDEIKQALAATNQQDVFKAYLDDLKANASIKNYLETETATN